MVNTNDIVELKQNIEEKKSELSSIKAETPLIELINSTNLLRENEFLKSINQKKSSLIESYEQYVVNLEGLLSDLNTIKKQINQLKKKPTKKTTKKRTIRKKTKK